MMFPSGFVHGEHHNLLFLFYLLVRLLLTKKVETRNQALMGFELWIECEKCVEC